MRQYADQKGLVRLDPLLVEQRRLALRLSKQQLYQAVGTDPKTARKAIAGERCVEKTARRVCSALKVESLEQLLVLPDQDGQQLEQPAPEERTPQRFQEWDFVRLLLPARELANGLVYSVSQMQSRLFRGALGRGKQYELRHLSDAQRERASELLVRHADVCRRVGPLPMFPVLEAAGYVGGESFWVVDRWVDGRTMAEVLLEGPLAADQLAQVMRQLAEGIAVLHEHGIIRRELTPEHVILRDEDGSALMTDLELAKLLDGSPTVSRDWKENAFLAPELGSGKEDHTVDFFSWAQLLYYAASGRPPQRLANAAIFDELDLPAKVRNIAKRCVEPRHSDRPQDAGEILKHISRWQ